MNKLLPTLEELKPIIDPNNTFYDCGFNDEFSKLSEQRKLQIICDIVKETTYPNPFPNPETELQEMNGNCHTTCIIAKKYIEELKLCKNIKYVMVRKRKFDPEDIVSIHAILLIEANDGETYQFDASPYVGYKMGTVQPIKQPIYEEYVEINEEMNRYIRLFKEIIYKHKNKTIDNKQIKEYIDKCLASLKYPILGAYSGNALKILKEYIQDEKEKNKIKKLILELRPYSKENIKNKEYQKELLNKQIKIWREELNDLIASNKNIKRQLELSQCIIQELKMQYPEYERTISINGNITKLSFINPRFLYEKGLNTIMIKTSAFFLKQEDYIEKSYTEKYHHTGEYSVNLSLPTEQTGIKPMLFSHPLGETCIRSLMGESKVILIEKDPITICKQKKALRESLCQNMWNTEQIWLDGKPIVWDPFVTNLIHGTDNAAEAALHYLIGNPEHQNMTRFMYPNPKLIYKKR